MTKKDKQLLVAKDVGTLLTILSATFLALLAEPKTFGSLVWYLFLFFYCVAYLSALIGVLMLLRIIKTVNVFVKIFVSLVFGILVAGLISLIQSHFSYQLQFIPTEPLLLLSLVVSALFVWLKIRYYSTKAV